MSSTLPPIEQHPLQPFLPPNARILLLGSFPPGEHRWSMPFFYPNFQNDMWRIMGWLFFADKLYFIDRKANRFDKQRIVAFCQDKGIALFDTAISVRRLKENASDKYLDIIESTNLLQLLQQIPLCKGIVATGEKAATTIASTLHCATPSIGEQIPLEVLQRELLFFRMPSSSRAYPLSIEQKSIHYQNMLITCGLL